MRLTLAYQLLTFINKMSRRLLLPAIPRQKNGDFAAIYRVNPLAFGW